MSEMGSLVGSPNDSSLMMLGSQLLSVGKFNNGLPNFMFHGLDCEQIWQQLELRNSSKSTLNTCTRNAVKIQSRESKRIKAPHKEKKAKKKDESQQQENSDSSDSEENLLNSIKKRLEDGNSSEEDALFEGLENFDDDEEANEDDIDFDFKMNDELLKGYSESNIDDDFESKSKAKQKKRNAVVDDRFFKLADMEEFLDSEDRKEERRFNKSEKDLSDDEDSSNEDDDNGSIDMFTLDDETEAGKMKYSDFFDPPYEDGKKEIPKNQANKEPSKEMENESEMDKGSDKSNSDEESDGIDFDDKDESDDEDKEENEDGDKNEDGDENEDSDENEDDDENDYKIKGKKESVESKNKINDLLESDEDDLNNEEGDPNMKSTFERRQEELQKKAREMEEISLKEATWELKGEATAGKRPENSLLETVLDFQHTTRAAPTITDDTTKSLEEYIRQRIKDKTFDDVERKSKPKDDAFEFKKRVILDQEKSKKSLGELYEEEFIKQQQNDDEEIKADPECEKIEKQLDKLFHQLDALTNYRYTPMKPGTEVKIIVNTPAITMEEVAPTATAESELLAPEEVYEKKKGDVKGDDERSSTDKKRALRQKKKDKRERKKAKAAREKAVEKLNPGLGNKYSKEKTKKELEKLAKQDKSITVIKGENKKLGSSTAFFSQLQDEVTTNVKSNKAKKDAKKRKLDPNLIML